jgi:hypothetical protein
MNIECSSLRFIKDLHLEIALNIFTLILETRFLLCYAPSILYDVTVYVVVTSLLAFC